MKIERGGSRHRSAARVFFLLLVSSLLHFETPSAYETEKVIVIFMGGVRNSEAFDDTSHQYIPTIAQNIMPQGTVYRNFYTMTHTGMATCTFTAVMGTRRNENNRGSNWHGLSPTIFEYYRKDSGAPQNSVWALLSTDFNTFGIDHSLHPAFGEPYASSIWASPTNSDTDVLEEALLTMDRDEPAILTIHFRKVDRQAQHTWDPDLPDSVAWELYTDAILEIDSYVGQIWDKVTTDPAWAGKTTLFVTSAHGRHSPAYGDFEWHGDACDGCRRLPFIAAGPDFRQGVTVDERGDLIDLCSTIGELLSFDPVFSEGRVLTGLFSTAVTGTTTDPECPQGAPHDTQNEEEILLSRPGIHSHTPSIVNAGNTLHVLWTESGSGADAESWDIAYRKSTDRGQSWSETATLLTTQDPDSEVLTVASMSGDSSNLALVVSTLRLDEYAEGDSAWVWDYRLLTSEQGDQWESPSDFLFDEGNLFVVDNVPAISVRDSTIVTVALADRWNRHVGASLNLGLDWFTFVADYAPDDEFTSPDTPSIVMADSLLYVETMRYRNQSRILFFTAKGNSLDLAAVLDDSPDESIFPQLAVSDSMISCVWIDDRTGTWEVFFTRSIDRGITWSSNIRLSDSRVNTWRPALAVQGDTILVVWEDYRDGESSIYKKVSFDGGLHWSADTPEVTSPGISTAPKLAAADGSYFLTWQDYRSGEWEIYARPVDIDLPVGIGDGENTSSDPPLPRHPALLQNTPNPFNPATTIGFELTGTEPERVTLSIFDLRGRPVRLLADGDFGPGTHRLVWNGRDGNNNPVASGIYLYTLEAMGERITRKMLLAR